MLLTCLQQAGGRGVGARHEDGLRPAHVGGEARGVEGADELARRYEDLASHVAALLLARELILEVDGGGTGLDHGLHQLERVERPAETGLGIGDRPTARGKGRRDQRV